MKKKLPYLIFTALVFGSLLFFACTKQSEGSGVTPGYAEQETTTGGNPHASTAGSQTSTT
jgi:hypothetical protein